MPDPNTERSTTADESGADLRFTRRSINRALGAGAVAALVGGGSIAGSAFAQQQGERDPYRPEYHFSPNEGWMNDPNGLVYQDGTYHLFYQAGEWPRRWDHASGTDLLNWEEHGTKVPAVEPTDGESGISPFSGGAVVDENDTAGFGEDAIVAMYTGHFYEGDRDGIEDQRVAYSTDNGDTVQKYEGNPVIPSEHGDWRDPRPFWYAPDESWRMVITRVGSTEDRPAGIEIYSSDDLLDWTYESTYGSGGERWETPNLVELPVEGREESAWVMTMSIEGTREVEHHVGHFDGTEFISEAVHRADFGYDFYAPQFWANTPEDRGLLLVWMNNWNYAMETPDPGWQGAMTIPRTVTLRQETGEEDGEPRLAVRQHPAEEMTNARTETLAEISGRPIPASESGGGPGEPSGEGPSADVTLGQDDAGNETAANDTADADGGRAQGQVHGVPVDAPLADSEVEGRTLELLVTIDPQEADRVGLRVREGADEATEIAYDTGAEELRFDRANAGEFFEPGFFDAATAPLEPMDDGTIELRVFVDRSSVELFANDGRMTMSNIVFPDWESTGVSLFAERGAAMLEEFVAYELSTDS